jgi:hypothetical protein
MFLTNCYHIVINNMICYSEMIYPNKHIVLFVNVELYTKYSSSFYEHYANLKITVKSKFVT